MFDAHLLVPQQFEIVFVRLDEVWVLDLNDRDRILVDMKRDAVIGEHDAGRWGHADGKDAELECGMLAGEFIYLFAVLLWLYQNTF